MSARFVSILTLPTRLLATLAYPRATASDGAPRMVLDQELNLAATALCEPATLPSCHVVSCSAHRETGTANGQSPAGLAAQEHEHTRLCSMGGYWLMASIWSTSTFSRGHVRLC